MSGKELLKNRKLVAGAVAALIAVALMLLNFTMYDSVGFDLTEETGVTGEYGYAVSPHLSFPKGEYQLLVRGSGQVTAVTAEGNVLGSGQAGSEFSMALEKDESDIILFSQESGAISRVDVTKEGMLYSDLIFLALFVLVGLVWLLYLRFVKKGGTEDQMIYTALFAVIILSSYPVFSGSVGFGHDLNFHLYRMEGIKDGLLSGQFPVRVHPTHNNGYGYISSSVYPELFFYFPAVLRLLGMSPVMAYNTFLVAVNAATALIMYWSARGISKSRYVGLLAAVIYTTSTWRVMNLYYRAAVGEALAMVFFPLLIYGLYCLLKGDRKKWWVLTLACTGIFQSHIISTVFAALTIIVFMVIFLREFLSDRRWLGFIKAGVATVLLNLWYLAAFCTYYLGADLAIRHTPENTEYFLNAVIPTELFNVLNTSFGYSLLLPNGVQGDLSLSLGVGVTLCLLVCGWYFVFRKKKILSEEKFALTMTVFGAAVLFMSTALFPWELLQQNKLINAFCGTVRMPWRFLSLASPFFCMAGAWIAGAGMPSLPAKRNVLLALSLLCAAAYIYWGTAYTTQAGTAMRAGQAAPVDGAVGWDNEYYIYGTDVSSLQPNAYHTSGVTVDDYEKSGTNIRLELSGAQDGGWVEVPLLYYEGYTARDNNGTALETLDGSNHVLRVNVKAGSTQVDIRYGGLWYFKVADVITLLCAAGLIWYGVRMRKERNECVEG